MSAEDIGITLIAACATVQSLLGVADATAALGRLIQGDGGTLDAVGSEVITADGSTITLDAPVGLVAEDEIEEQAHGLRSRSYQSTLVVDLLVTPPADLGTAHTALGWARDQQLAIHSEMRALLGASTSYFSRAVITLPRPLLYEHGRAHRGDVLIPFTIERS